MLSFSDSTFIDFKINGSKESWENRFMIVFKKNAKPAYIATYGSEKFKQTGKSTISMYPNPTENKMIKIALVNQQIGEYDVELINNLGQVCYNKVMNISNSNTIKSIKFDNSLATGNYHLNIIGPNGKKLV